MKVGELVIHGPTNRRLRVQAVSGDGRFAFCCIEGQRPQSAERVRVDELRSVDGASMIVSPASSVQEMDGE